MKRILISLLIVMGLASLIYPAGLQQKNPETIFLTGESLKEYATFKSQVVEKHTLVIKQITQDKEKFYNEIKKIEKICFEDCQMISQRSLSKKTKSNLKNELMQLETDDYSSVLIMDNSDEVLKKVLLYTHHSPYWMGKNTFYAGLPYTNYLLDEYSHTISDVLFPMMFILGFFISLIFIKKLSHSLIVYLPCLFSAGFSLSTIKYFFSTMNMVTSIIPLVVFTVTLSLSFHLYFSLVELKTLKAVFKIKWAPIFLMMFTTYIGFLSLIWAEISTIRNFGLFSAQLVLFSTLFTFLWYFLFEIKVSNVKNNESQKKYFKKAFNNSAPLWIVGVLKVIAVFSVIFVPSRLEVITDATRYFPPSTLIRERILDVASTVSGMPVMEIVIKLDNDLDMNQVLKIDQIEHDFENLALFQKYKIISNNRLLKKINFEYSGVEALPQAFASYLLLRGQLPFPLQESYGIDKNYRMTLLGVPLNYQDYQKDLESIKNFFNSRKIPFSINGIHHNLMIAQESMIQVLVSSFLSSAFIIFLFSAIFLKSFKDTIVFILVSLLPVALTFGFMILFKYSINIATVMTFSISLGMVGDSSFHIIYARKNPFKSFDEYNRGVLTPVVGSGLLLCVCFGMFAFNPFLPIREFGGILALILGLGTLADLYVLPTLLYGNHKHKDNYEALIRGQRKS